MRMNLQSVRSGLITDHAKRILLYATEGVGKSTFAASAPSPIFLCPEDGTAHLDVARFPEPESWADVRAAVATLRTEPHDYKTFVVDTLDWIEPLCWAHVCKQGKRTSIEDFGFGKGYVAALDEWRAFVADLDRLRAERKMQIILLAHAIVRTFKNPDGEDFDRYNLKIHEKAAGLFKEWSDVVLFANHETYTSKINGREKGISTGARVMHTERRAAFDAKNRYNMPDTLPLSYTEFDNAVAGNSPERANALRADIRNLLREIGDEKTTAAVEKWLSETGDSVVKLSQGLNRLAAKRR